MKKTLLILLASLSIGLLWSQPYESIFGGVVTQWNMTMANLPGIGTDEHISYSDTLINGKEYQVVMGYSFSDLIGFLREDRDSGKAWYMSSEEPEEILIMDLSLNLGDSFYVQGNWNPNPGYYAVDSVYYHNSRKHIRLDFTMNHPIGDEKLTFIEGVSTNAGFRYQDNTYINNFSCYLLCMFKDGVQVYGPQQCFYSLVDEHRIEAVKTYPNPTADLVHLTGIEGEINYRVTNTSGKTVLIGLESLSAGQELILSLNLFPAGIYFIELFEGAKLSTTVQVVKH